MDSERSERFDDAVSQTNEGVFDDKVTLSPESAANNEVDGTSPFDLESNTKRKKFMESNAGDGTKATDQYITGFRLFLTLLSCVASLFVVALDQTIISTILSDVGNQFDSFSQIGWLTSGFLLPMACFAPSYGKISIAFGRKNTILYALVVFEIGSLIAALAQNMGMLIGGRVIQGLGGGAVQAMVIVILTECVPMSKRALSMTLMGVTFSIASVAGPFAGGGLAEVTWRWCFFINLPIGGIAFVLLLFFFNPPRTKGNLVEKLKTIDYIGTFLLTTGLVLVLLGLTFGGVDFPWRSAAVICCFIIGGLLLIAFGFYNFRVSTKPIIIKEILVIPQVVAACTSATFNFAFFMANLTYLAVYFQVIFNASAWLSGIDLLPFIIAVTLSSVFNGVFMRFTRYIKITMMISAVFAPLGNGLILLLNTHSPARDRIGLLIIMGISVGLQFQSSLLAAQMKAPPDVEGSLILVTILLNFSKSTGAAVGIALAQMLFTSTGTHYISQVIDSLDKSSEGYKALSNISAKTLIQTPSIVSSLPTSTRELVKEAFMKALKNVFYLGLAFAIVSFIASLFTTNQRIPRDEDMWAGTDDENEEENEKENEVETEKDKQN